MTNLFENFIDSITMYRLILLYLIGLIVVAFGLGFIGLISINPWLLIISTSLILTTSYVVNSVLEQVFEIPVNKESYIISALILALIITPTMSFSMILFAFWASVWAIASKFILNINKKHIFNPVAIALVITGVFLHQTPSWWVGTLFMLPFVLLGGVLIVKKISRFDLVISFVASTLLITFAYAIITKQNLLFAAQTSIVASPIVFFSTVMLTEPITTPPTRLKRIIYGIITGIVFNPLFQIGPVFSTPELALCVGNIYSYLVSPKEKMVLRLKEKKKISEDSYDFVFFKDVSMNYFPGQYLEWTLSPSNSDERGNRRYFTLASSPTENDYRIGVKFSENSSTFKKELKELPLGSTIVAGNLSGEFILPSDSTKKLVFIAGGIGITPFRSMLRYCIDKDDKRDIVLFYTNRKEADLAYGDILEKAKDILNLKVVYSLTDKNSISSNWQGNVGYDSKELIIKNVPDFTERLFFISGPPSMVNSSIKILKEMGTNKHRIIIDYFPGFT